MYLHELPDFSDLLAVVSGQHKIAPFLIEKDYWIMHCLYGLQKMGISFELKGGTSLSKGYGLIHRFSEDIDIHIQEPKTLRTGRNHNKLKDVAARKAFYDALAKKIEIAGIVSLERDSAFDDARYMRSAGIRLHYEKQSPIDMGVKDGILLEAGFDQITPNRPVDISSWAYDFSCTQNLEGIEDNRALAVKCYDPGYTFVEKLQTISTKFRQQQDRGSLPQNFMRHYYDIYCLLKDPSVQEFIGTAPYLKHKEKKFRAAEEYNLTSNEAFVLSDASTFALYEKAYNDTAALYYKDQPAFVDIISSIQKAAPRL